LRNAFQHAQAHQIEAEIIYDERQLLLRVRDDGNGMDADIPDHGRAGHFGLPGIRERAKLIGGSLEVRSRADLAQKLSWLLLPPSLTRNPLQRAAGSSAALDENKDTRLFASICGWILHSANINPFPSKKPGIH
jgi:signal transduction histidine kinase